MRNIKFIIFLQILFLTIFCFIYYVYHAAPEISHFLDEKIGGPMLMISAVAFYGLLFLGINGIQKFIKAEKTNLSYGLLLTSIFSLIFFIGFFVFTMFYKG